MEEKSQRHTFFTLIFILVAILTLTSLAYRYREEIEIPRRIMSLKETLFPSDRINVKFQVVAGINGKNLRVKFAVPCGNMKQKYKILKRLPGVKHEMLMSMTRPEVIQSIEERDFGAIKRNSLQVINRYSPEKIDKLYMEFFFLN